jgi:ligand-binding sensor domain-containing protein
MVHSIIQDSKGKMWFATNGGVYIYDGTTLKHC